MNYFSFKNSALFYVILLKVWICWDLVLLCSLNGISIKTQFLSQQIWIFMSIKSDSAALAMFFGSLFPINNKPIAVATRNAELNDCPIKAQYCICIHNKTMHPMHTNTNRLLFIFSVSPSCSNSANWRCIAYNARQVGSLAMHYSTCGYGGGNIALWRGRIYRFIARLGTWKHRYAFPTKIFLNYNSSHRVCCVLINNIY